MKDGRFDWICDPYGIATIKNPKDEDAEEYL